MILGFLASSVLGSALKLGARGIASKVATGAKADVAAIPLKVKLALLAIVLLGVAVFVHQRHAHKVIAAAAEAARVEQRKADQAVLDQTVANYRAAADRARAADRANAQRVEAEQQKINERTANDYAKRIASARALADRLQRERTAAAADPGGGRAASVPGLPAAAGRPAQGAGQDGLPDTDKLIATEQAIQLDELIRWVRAQHAVDTNGRKP